jgi:hypothetical protein
MQQYVKHNVFIWVLSSCTEPGAVYKRRRDLYGTQIRMQAQRSYLTTSRCQDGCLIMQGHITYSVSLLEWLENINFEETRCRLHYRIIFLNEIRNFSDFRPGRTQPNGQCNWSAPLTQTSCYRSLVAVRRRLSLSHISAANTIPLFLLTLYPELIAQDTACIWRVRTMMIIQPNSNRLTSESEPEET